jgi:hypothetical protein
MKKTSSTTFKEALKLRDRRETMGGMFIYFQTPVYDSVNVICSARLADDNAEKVNESFRFETI